MRTKMEFLLSLRHKPIFPARFLGPNSPPKPKQILGRIRDVGSSN